jgi:hypothetical protein
MGTMLENLIETINKDFLVLKEMSDPKQKRKEASLLRQRIDSAQKLLSSDKEKIKQLEEIKQKLKN